MKATFTSPPRPPNLPPAPVDRSKNHWKSPEYAGSSVFFNTIELPHRCSSNMAVFKAAFFRSLWSFHPWIFFSIGMFKIRNIFQPTGFNRRTSTAYSRRMLSDYTGCSTNVRRNMGNTLLPYRARRYIFSTFNKNKTKKKLFLNTKCRNSIFSEIVDSKLKKKKKWKEKNNTVLERRSFSNDMPLEPYFHLRFLRGFSASLHEG